MISDWWSGVLVAVGLKSHQEEELDDEIRLAKRRLAEQERRLALAEELKLYRYKRERMILLQDIILSFSIIELLWTLTAVAAIYLATRSLVDAWADLSAVRPLANGRVRLASASVRREIIRMVVNGIYLTIGIIAGLIPANPNATIFSVIFGGIFWLSSGLLALSSWLDRRDTAYFRRYVNRPTVVQEEDRIAGIERRAGHKSAQERTADATERIADVQENVNG